MAGRLQNIAGALVVGASGVATAFYAFKEPLKQEREERIADHTPTESAIRLQEKAQASKEGEQPKPNQSGQLDTATSAANTKSWRELLKPGDTKTTAEGKGDSSQ